MRLQIGLLAAACAASVSGAETSTPDLALFERSINEQVKPRKTCFDKTHLKLFHLRGAEFASKQEEHLALLEESGLTHLLESKRFCGPVFTVQPGRVLELTEPFEIDDRAFRSARFEMVTDWQPWAQTPHAEELFDFPTPPTEGALLFRQTDDAWEVDRFTPARTWPPPDKCRRRCEEPGTCRATTPGDFPDFEETLEEWSSACGRGARVSVAGGECSDGSVFLVKGHRFGSTTHFFDQSGRFTSWTGRSDAGDSTCGGESFWPSPPDCAPAVVTQSYCGGLEEGQIVATSRWLPAASE